MAEHISFTFDRSALKDWFTPLSLSCDWWDENQVIVGLSWVYGSCDAVWSISRIITHPPKWIARWADKRWRK